MSKRDLKTQYYREGNDDDLFEESYFEALSSEQSVTRIPKPVKFRSKNVKFRDDSFYDRLKHFDRFRGKKTREKWNTA